MMQRCEVCGEFDGVHDEGPHFALDRRDAAIERDDTPVECNDPWALPDPAGDAYDAYDAALVLR